MRTDEDLRIAYNDLLDDDAADLVPIVRDLETVLPVRQPPPALTVAFERTLADRAGHGTVTRQSFPHRWILGIRGYNWSRQAMSLAALILLLAALVGSVAYAASTFIRVAPPEQRNMLAKSSPVNGMLFPPPGYAQYRPIGPRRASRESGAAVAYLQHPPAGFSPSVWIPVIRRLKVPAPRPAPGFAGLSMANRSVVQYRQGRHTILVALDQPSSRLAKKPLLLGEHTVRLPNGRLAWITLMTGSEESNMVATVNGDYVVVLASDLPIAMVERLATETVVIPASSNLPLRHLPADWPPPLPPQSAPAGVHIRLQAAELRASEAKDRLTFTFMFGIGNVGAMTARDINTTIQLPPVLARHAVDTPPHSHFQDLNTGSDGGFGGSMRVDVAGMSRASVRAALARGIGVRVTWMEGGKRNEHLYVFHIRR